MKRLSERMHDYAIGGLGYDADMDGFGDEAATLESRIEAANRLMSEVAVQGYSWGSIAFGTWKAKYEAWRTALAAEPKPKLADLGGGLSSYENLGRNPPEKRAALDAEEPAHGGSPMTLREVMEQEEKPCPR